MTPIKKPVVRQSEAIIRDRSKRRRLVIAIHPGDLIGLRPERTRKEFFVPIEVVWDVAMKLEAAAARKKREQARAERKAKRS